MVHQVHAKASDISRCLAAIEKAKVVKFPPPQAPGIIPEVKVCFVFSTNIAPICSLPNLLLEIDVQKGNNSTHYARA